MSDSMQNPEVHHEEHDVNVRAILWFCAIFVVAAVVIHVFLYFLFSAFRTDERTKQREAVTLVQRRGAELPPAPRLQPFPEQAPKWQGARQQSVFNTPVDDMRQLLKQEEAVLNQYGWADQSKGVVRIPIERAMQIVVQRGLPVRQPVAPAAPAGAEAAN